MPDERDGLPRRDGETDLVQHRAARFVRKGDIIEDDLSRDALPYATALAGACPWLAPMANLLPAELRTNRSRAILIPSIVLGVLLLLLAGALMAYSKVEERQYMQKLEGEIAQVQPQAQRSVASRRRRCPAGGTPVLQPRIYRPRGRWIRPRKGRW